MSFFNTLSNMFDRIANQADEHTIAWSLRDHADCVEDTYKSLEKLNKLQAKGAELDLRVAYQKGFAMKTLPNSND